MTQRRTFALDLTQKQNNSVSRAPALLLPSSLLPLPPWHYCCIAADVISCFLSGISVLSPRLTLGPLLNACPLCLQQSSSQHLLHFTHLWAMHLLHAFISWLRPFPLYFTHTVLLVLPCSSYPPLPSFSFCVCCANCAVVLFPLLSL